jgi:hypothetical protein
MCPKANDRNQFVRDARAGVKGPQVPGILREINGETNFQSKKFPIALIKLYITGVRAVEITHLMRIQKGMKRKLAAIAI